MPQSPSKRISEQISLDVADCVLSRNSLTIRSSEGFQQAGTALACMDECSQWWWSDYLLYAEKHGLSSILDSARVELHRSTLYSHVETGRLFAPEDRHPDLSFTHHRAIMYALGQDASVAAAKKWLLIAAEKKMTAGDLREAMRADARKDEKDPGPMRGVVRITDFVKVSRWAETVRTKDLAAEEADEIRKSTGPLFTFLCELHRKPFGSND